MLQVMFISLLLISGHSLAQVAAVSVTAGQFGLITYFPEGSAPASVISLSDSTLSARINSWVDEVTVRVGDNVSKGQSLIMLNCGKAQSRLAQQQSAVKANDARLSLAHYQLKRARLLREKEHVSEEVLFRRQADVDALEAEAGSLTASIQSDQIDVDSCRVKATFNGVIQKRMVDVGESVTPGQPLLQLVDTEQLEVSVNIPVSSVQQLRQASTFELQHGAERYSLGLRSVVPVTSVVSRHREARLVFDSAPGRTLPSPGDSGRLVWRLARHALPPDYLVKRGDQYGIFIIEQGKAVFKVLNDAQEGRPVLVNMPDDTLLIMDGRQVVNEGDILNIVQ